MRIYLGLFAIALWIPGWAAAAPQSSDPSPRAQRALQMLEQKFSAADANRDGKLTLAEAQAGMPRIAQHFDEIDTSHQGYITLDQIESFVMSRRGH